MTDQGNPVQRIAKRPNPSDLATSDPLGLVPHSFPWTDTWSRRWPRSTRLADNGEDLAYLLPQSAPDAAVRMVEALTS